MNFMGKLGFTELLLCEGIPWVKHSKSEFKHIEKNLLRQQSDLQLISVKGNNHSLLYIHAHPSFSPQYSLRTHYKPETKVQGSTSDKQVREWGRESQQTWQERVLRHTCKQIRTVPFVRRRIQSERGLQTCPGSSVG